MGDGEKGETPEVAKDCAWCMTRSDNGLVGKRTGTEAECRSDTGDDRKSWTVSLSHSSAT